jgi:endonuclease I
MKLSLLCFLSSVSLTVGQTYEGCSATEYYSSLGSDTSAWTKDALAEVLKTTHRGVLPFTNKEDPGVDDVWAALIDVDVGAQPGTVSLIYENQDIPDIPFGERSWVKEHLFPILRGVGLFGPDVSDIHNIRPVSSLVNTVRGTKYFGECGVLVRPETCQQPAEGAASDTCSCNRLFTPPGKVRGAIARALLYMDLRYDGSETFTLDLRLTDCPFQPEHDMAYLSQMLTWHEEDPPSEEEIIRNNKVCNTWQGNRNPFVDHPELANLIYGNPLQLPSIGESLIYEPCKAIPTLAPTYAPNQCDMYEPGDFQIWLVNSVDPDTVGLYSFPPMPEGFELFMTDNAWNGNEFVNGEGTLSVSKTAKHFLNFAPVHFADRASNMACFFSNFVGLFHSLLYQKGGC